MSEATVRICEMSPRDGLQALNRSAALPLATRVELVKTLQRAGLPYIEAGSFVSPRVHPSMADTAELMRSIEPAGGQLAALVPNRKYYERFRAAPNLDTVALFVSASEEYSLANTRMTIEEALDTASEVAGAARDDGYRLRAHLSGAFRDLTEANRPSPEDRVVEICGRLFEMGCEEGALADTDGRATPGDIERVIGAAVGALGAGRIGVHLHDRYGFGLTNAYVAYRAGVRIFDAAVGGIGGSKAVGAGAVGNIATEELVSLFHALGVDTGVDLEALLEAGEIVRGMAADLGEADPPSKLLARRFDATGTERWRGRSPPPRS
jgi:hydroxymethylglutaryl-CoA lyase